MTVITQAPPVTDLRTIPYKPLPGEYQLSVNLGMANPVDVFSFAQAHNLEPTVVQVTLKNRSEVHALLVSKMVAESPIEHDTEANQLVDQLFDVIGDFDAIRQVYGLPRL